MIAIVDDDKEIADAIGAWVKMLSVKTTVHYSAEDLLASIKDTDIKHTHYTAAILDINLPGINGLELGRQLRVWFPELIIIMVTALRFEEVENLGALPADSTLLRKPYDLDELERILFQTPIK